jgi:hypothetical protein
METRLTSMKYQLSVEQVRIRIKLKNTTNFVRRLAICRLPGSSDRSIRDEATVLMAV